jgi:hypothetical protein
VLGTYGEDQQGSFMLYFRAWAYYCVWLGWAYLTKKVPHAATMPIATAFKICISHRKNGLLNRLPTKASFSIFD